MSPDPSDNVISGKDDWYNPSRGCDTLGDLDDDLSDIGKKAEKATDDAVDKTKEVGGTIAEKTGTKGIVEKGKGVSDKFFTKVEDVAGGPLDKISDAGSSIADAIEDAAEKGSAALKKDLKKI